MCRRSPSPHVGPLVLFGAGPPRSVSVPERSGAWFTRGGAVSWVRSAATHTLVAGSECSAGPCSFTLRLFRARPWGVSFSPPLSAPTACPPEGPAGGAAWCPSDVASPSAAPAERGGPAGVSRSGCHGEGHCPLQTAASPHSRGRWTVRPCPARRREPEPEPEPEGSRREPTHQTHVPTAPASVGLFSLVGWDQKSTVPRGQ